MHESWQDDEDGYRKLAWAALKKDAEHMLSDCTGKMLEEDMDTSFSLSRAFQSVFDSIKDHENPTELMSELPPEMLKSLSIWAVVGIRTVFSRAVEAAIMNDEMSDSNDPPAD